METYTGTDGATSYKYCTVSLNQLLLPYFLSYNCTKYATFTPKRYTLHYSSKYTKINTCNFIYNRNYLFNNI